MILYLVEHVMNYRDDEDIKTIGIFSSVIKAHEAINKLKIKSGFKNAPKIIDIFEDDEESGFTIEEVEVDTYSWDDGFVRLK